MRIGGRTIGLGFYGRIAELHNRLVRARYFRGHGVHSPFVYNIVRDVYKRQVEVVGLVDGRHQRFLGRNHVVCTRFEVREQRFDDLNTK